MMKRSLLRPRVHDENGQSIVTLALASLFFLALLVVGADTAFVYFQRRDLQNTADAAALAGAQELNGLAASETPAELAAADWADKNLGGLTFFEPVVTENYTTIQVTVKKNASSLLGTFGFGEPEISARATARIAAPYLPGPGVVPIAVNEETWEGCDSGGSCEDILLKEWSGSNSDPPSDYHLIDIGGSGSSDVCDFLIGGSTNPITDPVDSQPGAQSSLHNCLPERMDAATANNCLTYDDVTLPDGTLDPRCNPLDGAGKGALAAFPDAQPTAVILIPVIVEFDKGKASLDVVGDGEELRTFAFFLIDESTVYGPDPTCADSGQCEITGQFITSYFAALSVNQGGNGEFDPDSSVVKVIELIE